MLACCTRLVTYTVKIGNIIIPRAASTTDSIFPVGVTDYWSALWWAFMDVTTVGSNIYAVTPTGKILSVVLAALGMMMFPIFTVYVTSLVQQANKRKEEYYQSQQSEPADTK